MSEIAENPDFKLWIMIGYQGKKSLAEVADSAKAAGLIGTANDSRNKELALLTMCSQGKPEQVQRILEQNMINNN